MNGITVSVILPTYNEAENIIIAINRIDAVLEGYRYEIIVVDDNSPDGTWKIAKDASRSRHNLNVIRRLHERGLSSAVLDGFAAARGDYLLVMDADLQHDEKVLPDFIREFEKGADIVIGSRKAEGGGIDGWSKRRHVLSWGATIIANAFINSSVSDPMSGFFGIRREVFERAGEKINPRGFKILLEFLARIKGTVIKEVGFVFKPRIHGESKLTTSIVLEYLLAIYDLSIGRILPFSFIQYGMVGFSGVFVNLGMLYAGLNLFHLNHDLSLVLAIELSIVSNYVLNNFWTFRDSRLRLVWPFVKGLLLFHVVCFLGALINYSVAKYMTAVFGVNVYLADLVGIVVATAWNYIVNVQITWKRKA